MKRGKRVLTFACDFCLSWEINLGQTGRLLYVDFLDHSNVNPGRVGSLRSRKIGAGSEVMVALFSRRGAFVLVLKWRGQG